MKRAQSAVGLLAAAGSALNFFSGQEEVFRSPHAQRHAALPLPGESLSYTLCCKWSKGRKRHSACSSPPQDLLVNWGDLSQTYSACLLYFA